MLFLWEDKRFGLSFVGEKNNIGRGEGDFNN